MSDSEGASPWANINSNGPSLARDNAHPRLAKNCVGARNFARPDEGLSAPKRIECFAISREHSNLGEQLVTLTARKVG